MRAKLCSCTPFRRACMNIDPLRPAAAALRISGPSTAPGGNMSKLQQILNEPGHTPLWIVFWLYGVVISHVLFGLIMIAFNEVDTAPFGLMLLSFVAYTAFLLNAVWRNAQNVGEQMYGQIARYLTVAWSINAVLVSGFLFLSHLNAVVTPLPSIF